MYAHTITLTLSLLLTPSPFISGARGSVTSMARIFQSVSPEVDTVIYVVNRLPIYKWAMTDDNLITLGDIANTN